MIGRYATDGDNAMKRWKWELFWVVFAVLVGLAFSWRPWVQYHEHKAKRDAAVAEMKQAEQERADLVRKRARYESATGREELAREWGYRKPGEKRLEAVQ